MVVEPFELKIEEGPHGCTFLGCLVPSMKSLVKSPGTELVELERGPKLLESLKVAYSQLEIRNTMKKSLQVRFKGEPAIDLGMLKINIKY